MIKGVTRTIKDALEYNLAQGTFEVRRRARNSTSNQRLDHINGQVRRRVPKIIFTGARRPNALQEKYRATAQSSHS